MYLESYIQLNKNLATSAQACSVLSYYVIQIWMYFVAEIITRKHNMTGYYQYTKITDGVQAAACVLPRTGPNRLFSSQPAPVHVFYNVPHWAAHCVVAHCVSHCAAQRACATNQLPAPSLLLSCDSPACQAGGTQASCKLPSTPTTGRCGRLLRYRCMKGRLECLRLCQTQSPRRSLGRRRSHSPAAR